MSGEPQGSAAAFAVADTSKLQRIHSGSRHKLFRGRTDDGPIVVKITAAEMPSPDAVVSMRHEYELLRDLRLPGVVRVLGLVHSNEGLALVMADAGERNLAERDPSGLLSIPDFLDVALQLAEAVSRLHEARIIHRDINPSNVVWDATTRKATLIDFGIATTLSAVTVENAGPNELEGTLAYCSPEQTGRTGRSVDSRTDLYSLGATFYEMLIGASLFATQDPVELVHAHLARQPRPPHEVDPRVPLAVSNIVLKLLEKEPERRYQTAEALADDLREARKQWQKAANVAPFPLAQSDMPRELNIPDKLYGRDEQLQTLREAFARACRGGRELVLVSGEPGIGKSALVSQLGRPVVESHGFYIAGKFDQLQRSVPYSGLAEAFRGLVSQLLTQPEAVLTMWRERIEAAVAPNGQILVDIVPELERVLGPQQKVRKFGPVESKNRFHLVFTSFLRLFARREHPLTLFLDDLQWVDAASLQLLQQWLDDDACHYLLVIGAYRESEVDAAHPLALSVAAWRETGSAIHEIHLGPIRGDDIALLTAEAFNQDVAATRPLADLIMHKTAGNPFFVRRLLRLMHSQRFIRFVPESRTWQWDVTELERAPVTDNVLDLMVQALGRLPAPTQTLLQVGSCIGHRFDLGTLAEIAGLSRTAATDQLWPALEDGLLLPMRETYKAPRRAGPFEDSLDTLPGMVQFAHDRVQQAAYSMLSEQRRRELHLDIGRRVLADAGSDQLSERLFEIVDQLDLGEALIVDPAERIRLVELNLAAGRKARASAAYQAAFDYLAVAMRHLPGGSWEEQPQLAYALHRELAECAYLTGRHAMAEELIETALEHAESNIAKLDLYALRVLAATVAGDWLGALRWGRDGLAVFGLEWPLDGLAEVNEAEARAVMANLGQRRIEDLVNEPEVEDEGVRACMRLLSILGPPAYFSGAEVLTFLVTRAANLSLLHGPSAYSAYAYVFYGAIHNARTGQYDVGYDFGKLALALGRRFGNRAEESRVLEVFGLVVHPWKATLRESLPLVREGFRAGVESGELAYAAFNLNSVLINGLPAGVPLADILADAEIAIEFATRHQNRTSVEISIPFRQLARSLTGATPVPGSFDDDDFEEIRFLKEAAGNGTALGHFWVAKLQADYLLGDYAAARLSSQEGGRHILAGILGMMTSAEHVFYTALALAAECDATPGADPSDMLEELRTLHRRLVVWAEHCPQNFAHKAALVGAEIAKLSGASTEAMKLQRAAIGGAAQQLCIQDEAIAHELRARFFLEEGEFALAAVHFRAARERYRQWGATLKVVDLEREHPECFVVDARTTSGRVPIDALALMKASQAISAETVPERLFERILRVIVEVAGAREGALLLSQTDAVTVRARIEVATEMSVSLAAVPLEQCTDLPAAILRYVLRMKEPLVLYDAAAAGAFASDPAVRRRRLRSVLCVPLVSQAKVIGLIHLENDAMAGAFAGEVVEVVQVLATQAVISLENARLHEASKQEIEQRTQAELALSEADRRKDEFLAMLAHELRNPLAPISNASEVLARMHAGDTRVQSAVGMIRRQATHLTRLVDDLLDVSRVTQGRIQLTRAIIDLKTVIEQAVETVEPLLRSKQHRVSIVANREPVYVNGDSARLVQCVGNILSNAAKYTEPRGEIRVQTRAEPESAVLEISDSGAGIPPQLMPRIFDLFVQGDRTIDRAQGGLGVGLAIVKQVVQMHEGQVIVRSEGAGRGSTFEIRLPRVSRPQGAVSGSAEAEAPQRRILVVDDNADAANSIVMLLSLQNQQTEVAYDGKQALERLQSFKPDVILLDLGLPGMDGYEVARKIRTMPEYRHTRIVALSGYGQPEDRRRTQAAGFDDHLVKPVDWAVLERSLFN
jgi:predicted ATPase/signal transduction histidine kinase